MSFASKDEAEELEEVIALVQRDGNWVEAPLCNDPNHSEPFACHREA